MAIKTVALATVSTVVSTVLAAAILSGPARADVEPTPVRIDLAPALVEQAETPIRTAATFDELYDAIDDRDGMVNSEGLREIRRKLERQESPEPRRPSRPGTQRAS